MGVIHPATRRRSFPGQGSPAPQTTTQHRSGPVTTAQRSTSPTPARPIGHRPVNAPPNPGSAADAAGVGAGCPDRSAAGGGDRWPAPGLAGPQRRARAGCACRRRQRCTGAARVPARRSRSAGGAPAQRPAGPGGLRGRRTPARPPGRTGHPVPGARQGRRGRAAHADRSDRRQQRQPQPGLHRRLAAPVEVRQHGAGSFDASEPGRPGRAGKQPVEGGRPAAQNDVTDDDGLDEGLLAGDVDDRTAGRGARCLPRGPGRRAGPPAGPARAARGRHGRRPRRRATGHTAGPRPTALVDLDLPGDVRPALHPLPVAVAHGAASCRLPTGTTDELGPPQHLQSRRASPRARPAALGCPQDCRFSPCPSAARFCGRSLR